MQDGGAKYTYKDFSLTLCQVFSALAVITLHANSSFWSYSGTENNWFIANLIESIFYFAVPIFFMITGITLLDYPERYSTKEYFKKRAKKVFVPYLFWSMAGVIYLLASGRITKEELTPLWLINGLVSGAGIIEYFWYFRALLFDYICIPIFAWIDKSRKLDVIRYILFAFFFLNILVPFINQGFDLGLEWDFEMTKIAGYLFFVFGGYYIYKRPPALQYKILIYVLGAAGLAMHLIGTYKLSTEYGAIIAYFKGYCNVPSVLYSFAVFVLLCDLSKLISRVNWLKKAVEIMGQYTLPAYLLQWFIFKLVDDLIGLNTQTISYRLLMPWFIYAVIMLIVWVLRKIPVIRATVP